MDGSHSPTRQPAPPPPRSGQSFLPKSTTLPRPHCTGLHSCCGLLTHSPIHGPHLQRRAFGYLCGPLLSAAVSKGVGPSDEPRLAVGVPRALSFARGLTDANAASDGLRVAGGRGGPRGKLVGAVDGGKKSPGGAKVGGKVALGCPLLGPPPHPPQRGIPASSYFFFGGSRVQTRGVPPSPDQQLVAGGGGSASKPEGSPPRVLQVPFLVCFRFCRGTLVPAALRAPSGWRGLAVSDGCWLSVTRPLPSADRPPP